MIQRQHVAIAREPRACPTHGDYEAVQWDLQPKPEGYPNLPGRADIASFLKPFWSSCPLCDKASQAEVDAKDAEILGGMTARQQMLMARLRAAGIPARYYESTIWNWQHGMDQQRRVWHVTRDYAQSFELALQTGRNLVFYGAPGTGKTHLAIGLCKHVMEKGGTGLYTTVMGLLSRIKNTYHKDADEKESEAIAAFTAVDLLVVDEVGRALDTGYTEAQFFAILNDRYNNLRPVLLVSNLNRSQLETFLGAALTDRIREAGGAFLVFDWASQRSHKQKPEADA